LVEVFLVLGGVFGAEAQTRVGDGQTAESLAGKTMLTMKLESRQWRCWWFCDSWQFLSGGAGAFHFGKSWYTSRLFSYDGK